MKDQYKASWWALGAMRLLSAAFALTISAADAVANQCDSESKGSAPIDSADIAVLKKRISSSYEQMLKYSTLRNSILRFRAARENDRLCYCAKEADKSDCLRSDMLGEIGELNKEDSLPKSMINIVGEDYAVVDGGMEVQRYSYPLFVNAKKGSREKLNRMIERNISPRNDDLMTSNFEYEEEGCGRPATNDLEYSIARYSNRYLAIVLSGSHLDCYMPHANHFSRVYHYDLEAASEVSTEAAINVDNLKGLFGECLEQLANGQEVQVDGRSFADQYGKEILEAMSDVRSWVFRPNEAVVGFDPYVAGTYADGFRSCVFRREQVDKVLTKYMAELTQ